MIHIAIVEDMDVIREGLVSLIEGSADFHCVGAFKTGEEALAKIPASEADVVLMDIDLPGMSGIECIARLKYRLPSLSIMMLTVFEDEDRIFDSLRAGATGYILKKTPPVQLLESIRELRSGGSPMSSGIARKVVEAFQQTPSASAEVDALSTREREILSYLAKGYRYKEIAETLFISIETVRTHLRNIYEKLQVHSRTEAVLKYLKH